MIHQNDAPLLEQQQLHHFLHKPFDNGLSLPFRQFAQYKEAMEYVQFH